MTVAVHLREGIRLGERYKLTGLIGKGSTAEVWGALDRLGGRQVAIKVITELMALSNQARRRFEREMQVIGSIQHANVVSMLDHGQVADGRPYLVMEHVKGYNFGDYLTQHTTLGPRPTLAIASQILEGLEAAHDRGVVHRDLKPPNIYLAELPSGKRRVKILDFGVAHLLDYAGVEASGRLTDTGSILGTPRYMCLEVAEGSQDIDGRADVFGVGAIMYHALSGEPPFEGSGIGEILNRVFQHDIRPLAQIRPDLPRRLVQGVERALARTPEERYPSAARMRRALDTIAAELKR